MTPGRSLANESWQEKKPSAAAFLDSLQSADAAVCPHNVRLDRFFRYWLIHTQSAGLFSSERSDMEMRMEKSFLRRRQLSYVRTYLTYMQGMKNMIVKDIRPCTILHITEDLPETAAGQVISLYKKIADFAYYECDGLYAERYSLKLSIPHHHRCSRSHEPPLLLDQDARRKIEAETGSIGGDLAKVLTCTGITVGELSAHAGELESEIPGILLIRSTREPIRQRRVPIAPSISASLQHVLSYLDSLHHQGRSQAYIQARIRNELKPYKFAEAPFSRLARNTFCDMLLENEVSVIMINILLGSKNRYGCRSQTTYFHPSLARLTSCVQNVRLVSDPDQQETSDPLQ